MQEVDTNILDLNKPLEAKRKLRGFIITIANSQEEVEAMQRGESRQFNMSPVLAENEQAAINAVEGNGQIVLSIANLELLSLQVKLLEDLAVNQNIELIKEDLFKVQQH